MLELSEIQTARRAMRDDAGATTVTKDKLAMDFHAKTVGAEGTVEDVTGHDDQLTVLLAIEGEVLTCPLTRVRGRSMEDTLAKVRAFRKGDSVRVSGKLAWKLFESELQIEIVEVE